MGGHVLLASTFAELGGLKHDRTTVIPLCRWALTVPGFPVPLMLQRLHRSTGRQGCPTQRAEWHTQRANRRTGLSLFKYQGAAAMYCGI